MQTFFIKEKSMTKVIICAILLAVMFLIVKLIFILNLEHNKKISSVKAANNKKNIVLFTDRIQRTAGISPIKPEIAQIAYHSADVGLKVKQVKQIKGINGTLLRESGVNYKNKVYIPKVTSRGTTIASCYQKPMVMEATAYTSRYEETGKRPSDPGYGITATGTRAKHGTVAVDPAVIPLGTKLFVESIDGTMDYGYATAEDTGGAIKGMKIDLYYDNIEEAFKFGRRTVRVYIVD